MSSSWKDFYLLSIKFTCSLQVLLYPFTCDGLQFDMIKCIKKFHVSQVPLAIFCALRKPAMAIF